jgi:hypothetical protein
VRAEVHKISALVASTLADELATTSNVANRQSWSVQSRREASRMEGIRESRTSLLSSVPTDLSRSARSATDQYSSTRRYLASLDLDSLPPGTSGSPAGNKAGIGFVFIPKHFSIEELQQCCATNGAEEPSQIRFSGRVFYVYRGGGGGVVYPDRYLTEIDGKILGIDFSGPWKDSKSPIEETERLEPKVLSTFRTY